MANTTFRRLVQFWTLLLLASLAAAQNLAYNGSCSKGGQAVLTQNIKSRGTQPINGAVTSLTSGVVASYPNCLVSVYLTGTTTAASIFKDPAGTQPITQPPFTANNDGSFLFFAAPGVGYDVVISGAGLPASFTFTDVVLGGNGGGPPPPPLNLLTNGILNPSQTTLNLANGPNFTFSQTTPGTVTGSVNGVITGPTFGGGLAQTGALLNIGACPIGQTQVSTGSGYTCGSAGSSLFLQTNGTANVTQSLLNLANGFGITQSDNGLGTITTTLNNPLPNGAQAVTQPAGDTSADVATDSFVSAALASSGLLPQSGCGVEAIAGTLKVSVGACINYTINSLQYSSPLTTLTLATADPTNPRLDLIGVNSAGSAFATTGTPAANPVEPSVDPSTQFGLTAVLVPAGATSPSLTVVDIYHDGTQWTPSSVGVPITTISAGNPYNSANPKSINGAAATTGNYAQLTDPAAGTVTLTNYNNLVFYVDPSAAWPATRSLTIQWYSGATAVGSPVLLGASGTFGFNSASNVYQQVAVPTPLFATGSATATSVRFTVSGSGATISFDIADITLQGGAASGGGGVFMTNRGAWNTTASYNAQNVVTYLGVSWIALAANTNSAPSTTNTNWQVMTAPCTTQQVLYNSGGLITCDSGFTYNPITHALTVSGSLNVSGGTVGYAQLLEGSAPSGVVGNDIIYADSSLHCFRLIQNNGATTGCLGTGSGTVTSISTTSPVSGCSSPCTSTATIGITANGITATQLAAQYSKGSCTEVWGGSGAANAMQAGDDAIVNNSCYNDSGVTRTITALKCRSDNAANTTVLTPTMGSAGTGTAILTGTVTCGNSYAYSATGTVNNASWTTGTGIDPGMSTVGNSASISMIVEYTY